MKRILLVEDDPLLVDIYTAKLKEAGFSIDVAEDGEEGIKKLQEGKFDLVILDIVLPRIDGWEILEKIKNEQVLRSPRPGYGRGKREQKIKGLKIVILSNLSQKSDVEKGLKSGIDKYLIKAHFTPGEVVKEINKILKNDNEAKGISD